MCYTCCSCKYVTVVEHFQTLSRSILDYVLFISRAFNDFRYEVKCLRDLKISA